MSDTEPLQPLREGLPSGYRMRADAHYVDLLEQRVTSPLTPVTPADRRMALVGRRSRDRDDSLSAGRDLERALTTLTRCAALLADAPSELSRAVVADLVRAEAWRAATLLHGTRLLRKELSITRKAVSVAGVIDKVLLGFQPQRRVRPVTIDVQSSVPSGAVVVGDEPLLLGAVSWALLSSLAVIEGLDDVRLVIDARPDARGGVTLAVSQSVVTPPAIWQARAFDATWTDRPGGTPGLVWMLALQEAATVHGGAAKVECSNRGTTIGIRIPAGV